MPTIEDIPVWTLLPDWATEVISRYDWLTSIAESRTQAEQRRALRVYPRVTMDMSFVLYDRERAALDLMLAQGISKDWYVPLPYEIGRLSAPLSIGATSIAFAKAYREYNEPGFALLIGDNWLDYEVISIESASLSHLTVTATEQAWPAGTRIFPLRKARIINAPRTVRTTVRAGTATVNFLFIEPLVWEGLAALTPYADYPVWDFSPNEIEPIDFTWGRNADEMDNDVALPIRVDLTDLSYTTQSFRWLLRGREEHAAFLDLIHFLKGRLTPFWISTYARDLEVAATVANGATEIIVKETGYVRFGGPVEGKNHIEIRLKNGTVYRREITAADDSTPGEETLTLDSSLSTGFDPADVSRVSFLRLARLDQDSIEIAHATDTAGAARAATAIRSVRENRNGPNWTPVPFDNVEMIDAACGFDGAPLLYMVNANGVFDFGMNVVEAFTPPTDIPPSDAVQVKRLAFLTGGILRGTAVASGKIYRTITGSSHILVFDSDTGDYITEGTSIGLGQLRQIAYDGKYLYVGADATPQKIHRLTRNFSLVSSTDFLPVGSMSTDQIDSICAFNGMVLLSRRAVGATATETKFHLYRTDGSLLYQNFISASGRHIGVTYDGTYIYTANADTDRIYRWNPDTGAAAGDFDLTNPYGTSPRAPLHLAFAYE